MKIISCFIFSILTINCNRNTSNKDEQFIGLWADSSSYKTIGKIPTPQGYKRIIEEGIPLVYGCGTSLCTTIREDSYSMEGCEIIHQRILLCLIYRLVIKIFSNVQMQ